MITPDILYFLIGLKNSFAKGVFFYITILFYIFPSLLLPNLKKMIKKFFISILIAVLGVWILYLYFLYAGNPSIMWSRIQGHQIQSIIFFISIVAIVMLQWGNKLFKFLIFIIILINLYLLGDLFFRNNIGLDSRQFITLFGLLILALAITYITHRVRYIFMTIVGLGIVFVLLTGILPMYETIPNLSNFIQSQKASIVNQWVTEGTLIIKNALGTKQIPINEVTKDDIDLSQKTQISFASKTVAGVEKLFIDLGNGSFININPQSAITLEQSGGNTVMQILQGNVEYYIPAGLSGALHIIGKYKGKSIEEIQNTIWSSLVSQFEKKKEEFFINQLGGKMMLNPTINKGISFFINTLYSISPKTYQNNLTNYNNIQKYLGISTTWTSQKFTWESIRGIIDDIMGQVKKWAETTQINQRLQQ